MKTIEPDTSVQVSVSGRPQILTMPWSEAVEKFVKVAGVDPRSVSSTLETGRHWSARIDGLTLMIQVNTKGAN